MANRRTFIQVAATVGVGGLIRWQLDPTTGLLFKASQAVASVLTGQTPLPGNSIAQFVTQLPILGRRRVDDASFDVNMLEFQQKVLPDAFYNGLRDPFSRGTFLWGYSVGDDADARPSWPGRTVVARQGRPTTVKYENSLPASPFLRKYLTIDQTLHWADPLNQHGSFDPYGGPIPTVVHLHGAEVLSGSDGAPEAWFTSNGLHGKGYGSVSPTESNAAVFQYPNTQPATTLWFHDHSLGITRINILSGMAAFYLLRDEFDTGAADNPLRLPAGDQEIELMLQDRQFDTNGQLLFPDSTANPSLIDGPPGNPGVHPFWIPEFFGDTVAVNGRTWPVLNVEPRRYRFRFLNASNARFYRLGLADAKTGAPGPSFWQIGTDGGLLDRPVQLQGLSEPAQTDPSPTTRLFLAISERADVIIDFKAFAGKSLTLTNDAQVPFPSGALLDPADPTRNVVQFRVNLPLSSRDQTYDPASGAPLRGGRNQEPAIVRLADPTSGTLSPGVRPSNTRQLVLVEDEGPTGQPIVDLINNTKWRGIRDGTTTPIEGARPDQFGQGIFMTELPRIGSTEVWEFLNLTVDAHPIHIHLIQFQLINRQAVALAADGSYTYRPVYDREFPGGTFPGVTPDGTWGPIVYPPGTYIPGYGPPRDYTDLNKDHALGGNPAFSPFLQGPIIPPSPNEAGWKDTVKVFPGFVNRFVIRWAPTETAVNAVRPGQNLFQFDPTRGPGYVVHCHILDHEDNEMMRPYLPLP
ncbi:MAG TPA: multicopper oxidase domain-containing protein [Chloroflexota bacterium]|nr:multicopper oxidase domain-containing protein [Chloroflexota bacterium]